VQANISQQPPPFQRFHSQKSMARPYSPRPNSLVFRVFPPVVPQQSQKQSLPPFPEPQRTRSPLVPDWEPGTMPAGDGRSPNDRPVVASSLFLRILCPLTTANR